MDPAALSNSDTCVLETLLKSSRPPTDTERMTIEESTASADAQLSIDLCKKEAAILEPVADHRGVLPSSSFQNMPEDVLREICIACMGSELPILASRMLPLPYKIMQISSGMRHIVLTTPSIWASMHIQISENHYSPPSKQLYTALVCEARKWFDRAGRLPLNISVENLNNRYAAGEDDDEFGTDPGNILLDFLLSLSPRWKSISVACSMITTFITGIAELSAADVPQLRSVSFHFEYNDTAILSNSGFFTIPTMEHLTLKILWKRFFDFTVNWAILTSLTLRGCRRRPNPSATQIASILQQTRRLSFCDVSVGDSFITNANQPGEINLPLLKVLYIEENNKNDKYSDILDLINAPILEIFHLLGEPFAASSASAFFMRSPNIQELSLCYTEPLTDITELLNHCPSLTELSLRPHWLVRRNTLDANMFLRTFFCQDDDDVTCPRLEYFTLEGSIDVSFETLRQFLEAKRRGITTQNAIRPWRGVAIDLSGIADMDVRQRMLDLFSQKLKEGINVSVAA